MLDEQVTMPPRPSAISVAATGTGNPASIADPATRRPGTILTRMTLPASAQQVWDALMFYEEIDRRPPLLLRVLLPIPIRTEGAKSAVGDEATCVYVGGHLLKRVTRIEPSRHYGFQVVEQNLAIGDGLLLSGGCYTLEELPDGRTSLAVTTDYLSRKRPAWLWRPLEAMACHAFHRHLLAAIRRKAERAPAVGPA